MHAVRATALLLLLTASAAHADPQAIEAAPLSPSQSVAVEESSSASDGGTGAPSTENAGTGSISSTASPS